MHEQSRDGEPAAGKAAGGEARGTHRKVVAGVDIGGTNLRVGLVDEALRLHRAQRVGSQGLLGGDEPLAALAQFLTGYLAENLRPGDELIAVSLGFPSTVDAARRRVISTSNIPSIQDVDVPAALSVLGVPVLLDRDVNMLLRHDTRQLGLNDAAGAVLGCYIGTGFGSALAVDGQIFVGRHGVAGELGHIPFPGVDIVCGCGNTGCAETVASGMALERELRAAHDGVPIKEVFTRCGGESFVTEWLEYVAATVATAVNILDPTAVIVGGGVTQTKGFPRQRFEAALGRMVRKPLPAHDLALHYAQPGHHSGILGAAIYAFGRAVV